MRSVVWIAPIDDFFIYSLYHQREWKHGEGKDLSVLLTRFSYLCPRDLLVFVHAEKDIRKEFPDVTFKNLPRSEQKWVYKEWIRTKRSSWIS